MPQGVGRCGRSACGHAVLCCIPIKAPIGTPRASGVNQFGAQANGRNSGQGFVETEVLCPHRISLERQVQAAGGLKQTPLRCRLKACELGTHALVLLYWQAVFHFQGAHQTNEIGKLALKCCDLELMGPLLPVCSEIDAVGLF